MNFNRLFKLRIAQRQKRPGLYLSRKDGNPNSGQGQNGGKVHQTRDGVRSKLRTRQPKKIDQAHEDEPEGDFGQQPRVALKVAREKRKERHEKMKDQNE